MKIERLTILTQCSMNLSWNDKYEMELKVLDKLTNKLTANILRQAVLSDDTKSTSETRISKITKAK